MGTGTKRLDKKNSMMHDENNLKVNRDPKNFSY